MSLQSYVKDYYFPLMKIDNKDLENSLILSIENNDKNGVEENYEKLVNFINTEFPKENLQYVNKYFNRLRVEFNSDFKTTFNYIYFH